ncbi:MAG: hypothetical protein ACHQT7_02295 [Candidatus Levyibacteriota bacterium]
MEIKINKLKKDYESVAPPVYLNAYGLEDVWEKVEGGKQIPRFFFSRFMAIAVLVCIILLGGFGVVSAKSQPGSLFYPVKKFAEKTVITASQIAPPNIRKDIIHAMEETNSSPTPTVIPSIKSEDKKENENRKRVTAPSQTEENQGGASPQKENSSESVKGASTSASEKANTNREKEGQNGSPQSSGQEE